MNEIVIWAGKCAHLYGRFGIVCALWNLAVESSRDGSFIIITVANVFLLWEWIILREFMQNDFASIGNKYVLKLKRWLIKQKHKQAFTQKYAEWKLSSREHSWMGILMILMQISGPGLKWNEEHCQGSIYILRAGWKTVHFVA